VQVLGQLLAQDLAQRFLGDRLFGSGKVLPERVIHHGLVARSRFARPRPEFVEQGNLRACPAFASLRQLPCQRLLRHARQVLVRKHIINRVVVKNV
jgi:hypothetical protein